MRFAIFIRRGKETFDAVGEVPEQLRKRTLAVRGFDASGMMTGWEIVEGADVETAIERQFANVAAEYLHIHFAAPGATLRALTGRGRQTTSALSQKQTCTAHTLMFAKAKSSHLRLAETERPPRGGPSEKFTSVLACSGLGGPRRLRYNCRGPRHQHCKYDRNEN